MKRLKQSSSASEEFILENEKAMDLISTKLCEHKESAQKGLEYYHKITNECAFTFKRIQSLMEKENISASDKVPLDDLTGKFSTVISADYMLGKNLLYWGESAQPGKTYHLMQLVCDVFGVVDHALCSG